MQKKTKRVRVRRVNLPKKNSDARSRGNFSLFTLFQNYTEQGEKCAGVEDELCLKNYAYCRMNLKPCPPLVNLNLLTIKQRPLGTVPRRTKKKGNIFAKYSMVKRFVLMLDHWGLRRRVGCSPLSLLYGKGGVQPLFYLVTVKKFSWAFILTWTLTNNLHICAGNLRKV